GDVSLWKKFGNSLKLKLGLFLSDVDAALAQSTVESAAAAGVIGAGENCQMVYLGESPNTNPIYEDLVLSGRKDFVPANTIVDLMNSLDDPRRDDYFTLKADTTAYVGGIYGLGNAYSDFSHVAPGILVPEFPSVLFDDAEMHFYLAEAAARGFNVGDAAAHYNAGVTASILNWGGTQDEADAYLAANPYDAANWKNSIGTQAWIAFYVRGFAGYTSWRRLDAPTFNLSPDAQTPGSAVPVRFTYPITEQTLNKANYEAAASAIGGDDLLTKLFWDKN
ncbi:MAG TPA: SusD/RagB family nutrient-binding outer membrane lipoprotein, partial [Bacteroidetes bacterium]|nr:SusD/RagB family nutrient-binding outer membrane lipoprotein [Bacteroidota bacterium]